MTATRSFHDNFVSSKERDEFMFNKEFMSDCAFVIDEDGDTTKKIPCHKYILGCCSWEFYNLFYLLTAESSDIPITDVSFIVVQKFVEFVYKETTELDMETVWDVFILAKRFAVKKLIIFCENFLSANVKDENLVQVIEKSTEFDMDDKLRRECVKVIGRSQIDYFECQFNPEAPFFELSKEGLIFILKSDYLDREEIDIFRFINSWAENYCAQKNKPANSVNKRLALGDDVIKNIRFATLTYGELKECTINESILTDKQIVDTFNCIGSNGSYDCQFYSIKRLPTVTKIVFGGTLSNNNVFSYKRGHNSPVNSLILSVNKPITLYGFEMYGSTYVQNIKLDIQLKSEGAANSIYQSNEKILFDGSSKIRELKLKQVIILEVDKKYTLGLGAGFCYDSYFAINPIKEFTAANGFKITFHTNYNHIFASLMLQ